MTGGPAPCGVSGAARKRGEEVIIGLSATTSEAAVVESGATREKDVDIEDKRLDKEQP